MNNSKRIINFFKNYLSTILFISIGYIYYFNNLFYIDSLNSRGFLYSNLSFYFADFKINSIQIFIFIFVLYIVLLIPFYILYDSKSKALIVLEYLYKKIRNLKYKINFTEKTAILAWIVKLFFAPLMIFWLSSHVFNLINHLYQSYNNLYVINSSFLDFFNSNLFWLCFTAILFFDVFFFTLGYLIEIPYLKNKIKSVDPTFLWWFVALICYPPFNSYLTDLWWVSSMLNNIFPWAWVSFFDNFIWWYSDDFPKFTNAYIHIFFNSLIILLMWIYTWASISLWFKASNLTNRWIISKWPYRFVRHPAYVCKNLSWWIGWLPILITYINHIDLLAFDKIKYTSLAIFSLSAWTFIYFMRALTEERHLSMDKDYLEYKKKVKYKFIPWIY